jgi:checkpoint serine/threonine-protein kinase
MYPDGLGGKGEEFSFEELRARHRGLLGRNWSQFESSPLRLEKTAEPEPTCHLDLPLQDEASQAPVGQRVKLNDQTEASTAEQNRNAVKSARQDEKANRTRKIHVMEVRAETQTSKSIPRSFTSADLPSPN